MSQELLTAIKERIDLGHSDEQIKTELRSAGYDEETIIQVLNAAKTGSVDSAPVSTIAPALPKVTSLFKDAIASVFGRLDLWALLFVPVVIASLTTIVLTEDPTMSTFHLPAAIVLIVGALIYVLFFFAVVYIVANSPTKRVSITEGINWAKKHGLSLLGVFILSVFTVWGGAFLLVVPGIIVSIYIYLSQFVFVCEGHKGFDALLRSRELVYGRWWAVAKKLFGAGLLAFLVLILIFIPIGFITTMVYGVDMDTLEGAPLSLLLVMGVIDGAVDVFFTLFGLYVGVNLYQALLVGKPAYNAEANKSVRMKYKVLAWIGPLFIIIMIGTAVVLTSLDSARDIAGEAQQKSVEGVEYIEESLEAKERAAELRLEN